MPRRSRAREIALQALYRLDLNSDGEDPAVLEEFVRNRLLGNKELIEFSMSLLNGVQRNLGELDQMLGKVTANWSLSRMAATDRNVLRVGAFEIIYTEIPGPVAINEAVELARRFGSAQSPRFVNGILDRFLKERGSIEYSEEEPVPAEEEAVEEEAATEESSEVGAESAEPADSIEPADSPGQVDPDVPAKPVDGEPPSS